MDAQFTHSALCTGRSRCLLSVPSTTTRSCRNSESTIDSPVFYLSPRSCAGRRIPHQENSLTTVATRTPVRLVSSRSKRHFRSAEIRWLGELPNCRLRCGSRQCSRPGFVENPEVIRPRLSRRQIAEAQIENSGARLRVASVHLQIGNCSITGASVQVQNPRLCQVQGIEPVRTHA